VKRSVVPVSEKLRAQGLGRVSDRDIEGQGQGQVSDRIARIRSRLGLFIGLG
jgi:hypothetical protein